MGETRSRDVDWLHRGVTQLGDAHDLPREVKTKDPTAGGPGSVAGWVCRGRIRPSGLFDKKHPSPMFYNGPLSFLCAGRHLEDSIADIKFGEFSQMAMVDLPRARFQITPKLIQSFL